MLDFQGHDITRTSSENNQTEEDNPFAVAVAEETTTATDPATAKDDRVPFPCMLFIV